MRHDEGVFEIPRNVVANVFKLGIGAVAIVMGVAMFGGRIELWPVEVPFVAGGILLIVGNARALLARPPLLRATRAGLWFGGGSIISWHEVAAIHGSLPARRGSPDLQAPEVTIAFRRRHVLFRLPWPLWFTAVLPCRIAVPLYAADALAPQVVCVLEAFRWQACRDGAGDASELPVARIVVRS